MIHLQTVSFWLKSNKTLNKRESTLGLAPQVGLAPEADKLTYTAEKLDFVWILGIVQKNGSSGRTSAVGGQAHRYAVLS